MAGTTTISGMISGMKTDDIISQLLTLERRPILQYQAQQATLKSKYAAFQEANTRFNALKEAASVLRTPTFFSNRTAASSRTDLATATAELGATPGLYNVTVESTARAHQIRSQSFSDFNSPVLGEGSFAITAGGKTTNITVDSSNNTLSGLRTAINNANSNIRASIIQDGDNSYRLLISGKETGTANTITIQSSLTGGTAPTFSDLQSASNARVVLGSGANAITVERSTNTVRDLIPGVTLNLLGADAGTSFAIEVDQDRQKITDTVQSLVDQYNNAMDYVNAQFKFDADTTAGGVLLGDYTLRGVQDEIASIFSQSLGGGGSLTDAASLGLSLREDGKLEFNAIAFSAKLLADPEGVANALSLTGVSTDAGVQFLTAGEKTNLDGAAMNVEITQLATQSTLTAGAAQNSALAADETLTLNGVQIQLTAGMSFQDVLGAINARTAETGLKAMGAQADGTGTGNFLTLQASNYGSSPRITAVSSRSSADNDSTGFGNVAVSITNAAGESGSGSSVLGLNVAGTINGEPATGSGQILAGNSGNATTDSLRLRITGSITGSRGTVTLRNGYANAAFNTLSKITDLANGPIFGEQQSLEKRIEDLQKIITTREEATTRQEATLRLKFAKLETALAQFQSQSDYLTSQLSSMNKSK